MTTVAATTAEIELGTHAASVSLNVSVDSALGQLELETYPAGIVVDVINVFASKASLSLEAKPAIISHDIDVSTDVAALTLTTYDAVVWDGAAWKAWIDANGHRITRLYYFTLTGDADGTTDVVIPITSFQARRKSGDPTFFSVVIPWTSTYVSQVNARINGTMQMSMAYLLDGVEQCRETVCQADLDTDPTGIRVDKGGNSKSITLTGHKTESFTSKAIDLRDVIYESNDNGYYRYRCASCDMYLNPGDTARYDGNEITVAQIVYMVAAENGTVIQSMDVEEAAT